MAAPRHIQDYSYIIRLHKQEEQRKESGVAKQVSNEPVEAIKGDELAKMAELPKASEANETVKIVETPNENEAIKEGEVTKQDDEAVKEDKATKEVEFAKGDEIFYGEGKFMFKSHLLKQQTTPETVNQRPSRYVQALLLCTPASDLVCFSMTNFFPPEPVYTRLPDSFWGGKPSTARTWTSLEQRAERSEMARRLAVMLARRSSSKPVTKPDTDTKTDATESPCGDTGLHRAVLGDKKNKKKKNNKKKKAKKNQDPQQEQEEKGKATAVTESEAETETENETSPTTAPATGLTTVPPTTPAAAPPPIQNERIYRWAHFHDLVREAPEAPEASEASKPREQPR